MAYGAVSTTLASNVFILELRYSLLVCFYLLWISFVVPGCTYMVNCQFERSYVADSTTMSTMFRVARFRRADKFCRPISCIWLRMSIFFNNWGTINFCCQYDSIFITHIIWLVQAKLFLYSLSAIRLIFFFVGSQYISFFSRQADSVSCCLSYTSTHVLFYKVLTFLFYPAWLRFSFVAESC